MRFDYVFGTVSVRPPYEPPKPYTLKDHIRFGLALTMLVLFSPILIPMAIIEGFFNWLD